MSEGQLAPTLPNSNYIQLTTEVNVDHIAIDWGINMKSGET